MLRPAEQMKQIINDIKQGMNELDEKRMLQVTEKCSISNHINKRLDYLWEQIQLQDGGEATGLEILAGMPREEQGNLFRPEICPSTAGLHDSDCNCGCDACWWRALRTVYVYRSGKWEVKEVASCALSCCDGFQPMEDEVDPEEPEE